MVAVRFLLAAALALLPARAARAADAPPAAPAAERRETASAAFSRLAEDYWESVMRRYPLWATFIKHPGYDDRLEDNTPAGRARERAELEGFLRRLEGLPADELTPPERISREVLRFELQDSLDYHAHSLWQWDVDHMDGPQSWLPTVIDTAQPMESAADAERLLKRMATVPACFDAHVANLREGMKSGRVAARPPVEKTISQLKDHLAKADEATAYAVAAGRLPKPERRRYRPVVLEAVRTAIRPALASYLSFLEKEYLPLARTGNVGLAALPGGAEAYAYKIRHHTTLEKTPEELHQTGLDELAELRAEMFAIARRLGHEGELAPFLEKTRKEPANFFRTRTEILEEAQRQVARTQALLPEYFGSLPKASLVVKPIEPEQEKNDAAARYFQPAGDGSRPGIYYINTYQPETRSRLGMASLAAHEGVPGHHLQIALAQEQSGLPAFRRNALSTAFVEGWALYAERLAEEMGLYADDLARLGMLSDQAWRAARLVVDTGLHAKGWSRRQAIDFLKGNTTGSEEEVAAEIDRYIAWPGQALAYKVGQREISALRRETQARLGPAFDLKAFHDAILREGAVPLPVLRKLVAEIGTKEPFRAASERPPARAQ